mmetsp:Transcript_90793/g.228335  ORF Transcript_90793/g.228335 Transcript_90793/m.228335 type:complete len:476 (+) Transcript_90793:2108-3535(+)
MRSMAAVIPRIIEVGAVNDESAPQRLSISSFMRSCGALGINCSNTRRILVPRPAGKPPAPAPLSFENLTQASKAMSKLMTSDWLDVVTSSSIDHTATGHSRKGKGERHSFTMATIATKKCFGSLPSFRLATCFSPRWRYSIASESKPWRTGGNSMCKFLRFLRSACACSLMGLTTAPSNSSKALSDTVASTSSTKGSTFCTQSLWTLGSGQRRSNNERLEMQDFLTRMDSSADKLASTFKSKNDPNASPLSFMCECNRASAASNKFSADFRAVGFSSMAAALNKLGKSTYCGWPGSKMILRNKCSVPSPHLARDCKAADTPPNALPLTVGTASEQRCTSETSSRRTSSARAPSEPPCASRPLRSSDPTATSVANTRVQTRSLCKIRDKKATNLSTAADASGASAEALTSSPPPSAIGKAGSPSCCWDASASASVAGSFVFPTSRLVSKAPLRAARASLRSMSAASESKVMTQSDA